MTDTTSAAPSLAPCGYCGMQCTPGEYHPYAACLMFGKCGDSTLVRANLDAVRAQPAPAPTADARHWPNGAELLSTSSVPTTSPKEASMALTPEQINEMFRDAKRREDAGFVDYAHQHFARAIEAEVRKQDEALILQLVEALNECQCSTQERIDALTESGMDKHKPIYFRSYVQDLQRATDAITAARARLKGKP